MGIQVRVLTILAQALINNPLIQAVFLENGAMKIFLNILKHQPNGSVLREKAFKSLNALVGQIYFDAFMKEAGANLITDCLHLGESTNMRQAALWFTQKLVDYGHP